MQFSRPNVIPVALGILGGSDPKRAIADNGKRKVNNSYNGVRFEMLIVQKNRVWLTSHRSILNLLSKVIHGFIAVRTAPL